MKRVNKISEPELDKLLGKGKVGQPNSKICMTFDEYQGFRINHEA
jgi:hypothetical protein